MNRRKILTSLPLAAGAALLDPLIARVAAQSGGGEKAAPRFVFVLQGNGCRPEQLCPDSLTFKRRAERERVEEISLAGHALPPGLAPTERIKNRMTIIQGLSGRVTKGGHSTNLGALGGYQSGEGNTLRIADRTVDHALGSIHPGVIPWLGVGITNTNRSVRYNVTASGPNKALPIMHRPEQAFNAYFGVVAPGEARKDFALKSNLLDYMVGDVKRTRKELGAVGRGQLDIYLDAYEQLADRQSRLVAIRDELRAVAPVPDDKFNSEIETDRIDAQFQIATAALIGGVTNVATIASSIGSYEVNIQYKGLGMEVNNHAIGHGDGSGSLTNRQCYDKIRAFHFGLIGRMVAKFEAIPEGDGTMMDNTVIVYLSDAPEEHHSKGFEWPMVVIGNAGGRLKPGGRYLSYPDYGRPGHRTYNGLYNSLLHVAGAEGVNQGEIDKELGEGIIQAGPLPELLT